MQNVNFYEKIFGLSGKIAFVTGANGQLGKVICSSLEAVGCIVIAVDVSKDCMISLAGKKSQYIQMDITQKADCQKTFSSLGEQLGGIDILVNNAGVSTFEPFEDRSEEKFDWVMSVNLKGTFYCIQSFVNMFDSKKLSKGAIINIGSIYGLISPDYRIYTDCARKNSEIYGATKAGIIQMTRYFAVHLAERNIRVNAVSPGGIYNPANPQGEDFIKNYSFRCPMKRMANDTEMVGAILYLASDAASYTNGQNITVDGGMSCW